MTQPQGVTPGPNPPQFDALDSGTEIVTLQIGGNDIGFSSIARSCRLTGAVGTPCQDQFVTENDDELRQRIDATGPKVDAVIDGVKVKAPNAKIFVVNYSAIFPHPRSGRDRGVLADAHLATRRRAVHARDPRVPQRHARDAGRRQRRALRGHLRGQRRPRRVRSCRTTVGSSRSRLRLPRRRCTRTWSACSPPATCLSPPAPRTPRAPQAPKAPKRRSAEAPKAPNLSPKRVMGHAKSKTGWGRFGGGLGFGAVAGFSGRLVARRSGRR